MAPVRSVTRTAVRSALTHQTHPRSPRFSEQETRFRANEENEPSPPPNKNTVGHILPRTRIRPGGRSPKKTTARLSRPPSIHRPASPVDRGIRTAPRPETEDGRVQKRRVPDSNEQAPPIPEIIRANRSDGPVFPKKKRPVSQSAVSFGLYESPAGRGFPAGVSNFGLRAVTNRKIRSESPSIEGTAGRRTPPDGHSPPSVAEAARRHAVSY